MLGEEGLRSGPFSPNLFGKYNETMSMRSVFPFSKFIKNDFPILFLLFSYYSSANGCYY